MAMANKIDLDAAMAELHVPSSTSLPSTKPMSRFEPRARGDTSKTAFKPVKPKKEPDEVIADVVPSFSQNTNPKMKPDIKPKIEAHAEAEDEVAQEIDIFFNPFPLGRNEAELYVMEYPLRPRWRSYETEKRCTEMRMMPKCKKMEVDLSMDDDPETFDSDMAKYLGKYKQTLRSQKIEPSAEAAKHYAVGILRNNQLHLNPLDGTMQLRPVIRSNQQKRKCSTQGVDPGSSSSSKKAKKKLGKSAQSDDEDEDEVMKETRDSTTEPWNSMTEPWDSMAETPWDPTEPWDPMMEPPWDPTTEQPWDPTTEPPWDSAQTEYKNKAKTKPGDSAQNEDEDEDEPWVPLEFLPEGNIYSYEYQKKMAKTEHKKILEFIMAQDAYMRVLCPKERANHREAKEAIIREVRRLPLEDRLKKYFTEVSQLNRFDFIEHLLAPDDPVEEVLEQVQMLADLVRGVWVTKTSLLYEGYQATVRDYILLQFTKANSIPCEKLRSNLSRDVLGNEALRPLLGNLITKRPKDDTVKFKGPHIAPWITDSEFKKRYKEVVKVQMEAWSAREESIMERVREINKNGVSQFKRVVVLKEDKEKKLPENSSRHGNGGPAISASKSLQDPKIRKHLHEALTKIFDEQKVRTFESVVRDLRDFAKKLSALPERSDKNEHLMEGALCGSSAAPTDLRSVVKIVANYVHGVYVMKPPKKYNLRNVFIRLFMDANPKAVLRKQEIMQFVKTLKVKMEISESKYAQVVDDICLTTEDGGLMLKNGD